MRRRRAGAAVFRKVGSQALSCRVVAVSRRVGRGLHRRALDLPRRRRAAVSSRHSTALHLTCGAAAVISLIRHRCRRSGQQQTKVKSLRWSAWRGAAERRTPVLIAGGLPHHRLFRAQKFACSSPHDASVKFQGWVAMRLVLRGAPLHVDVAAHVPQAATLRSKSGILEHSVDGVGQHAVQLLPRGREELVAWLRVRVTPTHTTFRKVPVKALRHHAALSWKPQFKKNRHLTRHTA